MGTRKHEKRVKYRLFCVNEGHEIIANCINNIKYNICDLNLIQIRYQVVYLKQLQPNVYDNLYIKIEIK